MNAENNPYDTAFKDLAEQEAEALLRLLGALPPAVQGIRAVGQVQNHVLPNAFPVLTGKLRSRASDNNELLKWLCFEVDQLPTLEALQERISKSAAR